MSTAVVVTTVVSVVELVLATLVFVTIADPNRSAANMEKIPVAWRLLLLILWSLITGLAIQLGAVEAHLR